MYISQASRLATVGVLVLARDEASLIGPCLDSVRDADELLVADTGSLDGTPDIASQWGAHVIHLTWKDSFAEARNEALQHMTADWVLVLDADERLTNSVQEVRQWIQQTNSEGSTIKIKNRLSEEDMQAAVYHRAVRLFRRRETFQYAGLIHEDIGPSITALYDHSSLADSPLIIEHVGTLPHYIQLKNKPNRNKQLLLKGLAQNAADAFIQYGLGVTAVQQDELEQASHWFTLARENINPDAYYRPTLYRDAIKVLLARNTPHLADEWLQEALAGYPDYTELYLLQGQSLFQQGLPEEALHSFTRALHTESERYVMENGSSGYIAHTWIGDAARQMQQYEDALRAYNQALTEHPRYEPALHGFVAAAIELNVPEEEVVSHIEALWDDLDFPPASILVRVYKQAGYHHSLAQLCVNQLSTPQAIYGLTIAWIHMERYAEANGLLHHLLLTTRLHDDERRQLEDWQAICVWQAQAQGRPYLAASSNWDPAVQEAAQLMMKWNQSSKSAKAHIHSPATTDSKRVTGTAHQRSVLTVGEGHTSPSPSPLHSFEYTREETKEVEKIGKEATFTWCEERVTTHETSSTLGATAGNAADSEQVERGKQSEQRFNGTTRNEVDQVLDRWMNLLRDEALISPLQQWAPYAGTRDLACAKALFVAGDIYNAAEILLRVMAEQRLDAEGAMLLGEILMQKQHWQEALDLLEGARNIHADQDDIAQDVVLRRDRMLALAYVRLSEMYLHQAVEVNPQQEAWQEQLKLVRRAAEQLQATAWELPRTTLQRRNIYLVQSEAVRMPHRSE